MRANHAPVVLAYHGTALGKHHPNSKYWLSADKFIAHLDLLVKLGWRTACIRDLDAPSTKANKTVILTFDDGFANNYAGAFLPLIKRDMRATWFVVSDRVGSYASWMTGTHDDTRMLSAHQLKEMNSHGMEIGSHTCSHPDLTAIDTRSLEEEIAPSKVALEDLLGCSVASFAYPYGRFNPTVAEHVQQAGFSRACTTRPGHVVPGYDPYLLPRVTVLRDDSLSTFARKLAFAGNDVRWRTLARYGFHRLVERVRTKVGSTAE